MTNYVRNLLAVITGIVIAITLSSCSSQPSHESDSSSTSPASEEPASSSSNSPNEEKTASEASPSEELDLDNLQIGQTASWDNYSITIDSAHLDGDNVVVGVTMKATKKSKFANRYLDAFTDSNKQVDAEDADDVSVAAGESYHAELTYPSAEITSLRWDNWSNEAIWHLGDVSASEAPKSQANKSKLQAAVDRYRNIVGILIPHDISAVLDDPQATQSEVDIATKDLEAAIAEAEFQKTPDSYETLSYEEVLQNPNEYVGRKVRVSGTVVYTPYGNEEFTMTWDSGFASVSYKLPKVMSLEYQKMSLTVQDGEYVTVYGNIGTIEDANLGYDQYSVNPAIGIMATVIERGGTRFGVFDTSNPSQEVSNSYAPGEGDFEDGIGSDGIDPNETTIDPADEQIVVDGQAVWIPNGTGYIIDGSDTRKITSDDLMGKSDVEIWIARNEIFARHGRKFQTPDLQKWFSAMPWYSPTDNPSELTPLEEENVEFIRHWEAKAYSPYAK